MNLATVFERVALNDPEKKAIYWGDHLFSYQQLMDQSLAVAHLLSSRFGVKPGDRVALWLKNCPEFATALFGIFYAGAVAVPINNFLKPAEVNYILEDAEVDVVITDELLAAHEVELKAARTGLKLLRVEEFGSITRPENHQHSASQEEKDLAVIIYTSGTTGRPKGAMLSHGNLLHNVESCRLVLKCVTSDRMALLLPMFHSFMLTVGVLLPLCIGASIVLIRSLNPPKNVFMEVIQHQATVLPSIPQFFRAMTSSHMKIPLPSLRMCISGAAPLPVQTLEEFKSKFEFPLIEGYGLSEASPVVTKNPLDGVRKAGSIGLPIPNVEVTIQNDAGQELPSGEAGELCVRGGNVMMGYWKQPKETANVMRGDWLLTGDIGYKDADGYIYITDRKKDMLLVNGINVYPREVEEIIYQFPGVKEAAVIGIPDERRGEQALAYVVANEGVVVQPNELLHFLRSRLADYKVPKHVENLDALPRNATGKILKTALRKLAAEQHHGSHRP